MKQTNIKYYVISVFVVISLICVGFATWTQIKMFDEDKVEGSINADPVVKTDEYLAFDKTKGTSGIKCFDYYVDQNDETDVGFVIYALNSDVPMYNSTKAQINLYYSLLVNDYSVFEEYITVTLEISLASSAVSTLGGLLESGVIKKAETNATSDATTVSQNATVGQASGGSILLTFQMENTMAKQGSELTAPKAIDVSVIFTIKDGKQADFINAIKDNDFLFNTRLS